MSAKELNIGDYVRTKSYGIKRINGFSSTLVEDFIDCDYDKYQKVLINKKEVVKSNPNIIDLIEVGDYVNGLKVVKIEDNILTIHGLIHNIGEEDIKSIVTKEQFESMQYKVGDKENE